MRLDYLGTGTVEHLPHHGPTALLVREENTRVLFDCGSGAIQKMQAAGCSIGELDALVLSHVHLDHCADLFSLLFARSTPALSNLPTLPIHLSAPARDWLIETARAMGSWADPVHAGVLLHTLAPGDTRHIGPLRISAHATRHHASSLGFRVQGAHGTLALPSDTGPCDALVDICRDADLAILHCALPDALQPTTHLSPASALALLHEARPERAAITHRYSPLVTPAHTHYLRKHAPCPLDFPQDGDFTTLP